MSNIYRSVAHSLVCSLKEELSKLYDLANETAGTDPTDNFSMIKQFIGELSDSNTVLNTMEVAQYIEVSAKIGELYKNLITLVGFIPAIKEHTAKKANTKLLAFASKIDLAIKPILEAMTQTLSNQINKLAKASVITFPDKTCYSVATAVEYLQNELCVFPEEVQHYSFYECVLLIRRISTYVSVIEKTSKLLPNVITSCRKSSKKCTDIISDYWINKYFAKTTDDYEQLLKKVCAAIFEELYIMINDNEVFLENCRYVSKRIILCAQKRAHDEISVANLHSIIQAFTAP